MNEMLLLHGIACEVCVNATDVGDRLHGSAGRKC